MSIAVAASREEIGCAEDAFVLDALREWGAVAEHVVWDDPATDWSRFDAVIVRHTWDYYRGKRGAFCEWSRRVGDATRLFNDARTLVRNTHKAYLPWMESLGAPGVPTLWAPASVDDPEAACVPASITLDEPDDDAALRRAFAEFACEEIVLKPAVGGAAVGIAIARREHIADASNHLRRLRALGGVLVQPMVESVRTRGEVSLMFVAGEFTHAVRKVAKPGDFRVQDDHGGTVHAHTTSEAERVAAQRACEAWGRGVGERLMYARVDLVEWGEDDWRVIEFEAVEPEMFWRFEPRAAGRLAEAVLASVQE